MRLVDGRGDRARILRRLRTAPALQRLTSAGMIRPYTFGPALRPLTGGDNDTLALDDEVTDIAAALDGAAKEKEHAVLGAVLLLTDGAYTTGPNPIHNAEALALPVVAIGIGDSTEPRDLRIARVAANDVVYAGTTVPVDVAVKSAGADSDRAEVTLKEGAKELSRATLRLGRGSREYDVHLTYTPGGEGVRKYSVAVSPLKGELTEANNVRSFSVRVLKSKLHVVLVGGAPSPDVATIRQTLVEDTAFAVRSFVQRASGGFVEGALTQAALDSADCIVLIDMPTPGTGGQTLELLAHAIMEQGKPLLYVGGKQADPRRLGRLEQVLPFTVDNVSQAEQLVFFRPEQSERSHPLVAVGSGSGSDVWSRMPPVYRTQGTIRAKSDAHVLGTAGLQTVTLPDPLIISRSVARLKSVAITAYGLWRWRLMAQGNRETADVFSLFLGGCVRWLTRPDDSRPVSVVSSRDSYAPGEPVEFVGQVYAAGGQPVDNAVVRVVARAGERLAECVLTAIGSGRYEGEIAGVGEGEFSFAAGATVNRQSIGADSGRFSVGGLNVEFQDPRMNAELLRQMADATGGRFLVPDEVDSLDTILKALPSLAARAETHTKDIELWHWSIMPVVIVLLFCTEWLLRKRRGML
jgi:hypothetical protein